jgi:phosphatidylglycerophosphate synthase
MSDPTATPAPTPQTAVAPQFSRRPIAARDTKWAARVAAWLAKIGVTPNAISIAGIVFSAVAGAALLATRSTPPIIDTPLFLLAIVGIQLRLLCNLFDGMVAVEGGKKSKSGEVFNDMPDRIADPILLICAGYAAGGAGGEWGAALGWLAALLAVMTAYVRVLGRSLGTPIYFIGPMAKQHRMATLTAACIFASITTFWNWERRILLIALSVICVGCVITVVRRTGKIIRDLETRP